jgi:glycogen(starch) synthase
MLSWEYPPVIVGGLGRHVQGVSQALAAQGAEIHVLTRGSPAATAVAEESRGGVRVHRVPQRAFPSDIPAFLSWVEELGVVLGARALELTARRRFDLVHSHDWLVAGAARTVVAATGLPWIVTVHATEHGRHAGAVQRHPQSVIHAAEHEMAHDADHLITCSDYMGRHVAEVLEVDPRRISPLRNGIDRTEPTPVTDAERTVRARFAAPEQRLVLLAGRLVHEKGFHVALDALAPMIRARRNLRFVVAGVGPAAADLRRQAERLGLEDAGSFPGWVDDATMHSLYRTADLCLVPSLYEPCGIVALEAMAHGCPCLVADTGGLRELVAGDGSVDLRFPTGDADALRERADRLLDDAALRARLAARARARALEFDWAGVARDTRTVYARRLAPRGPAPARAAPSSGRRGRR